MDSGQSFSVGGFQFWIWIWLSVFLMSSVFMALLLKSLYNRLMSASHQAERLVKKIETLSIVEFEIEKPTSSIDIDPAIAQARAQLLKRARIKKLKQRQRRLGSRRFESDEGGFQ